MDMGTGGVRMIDWTGERCVPWTEDIQVVYEHYHRYAFALRFVAGKRVLDLASGEGYGSALMASSAATVVGLDVDEQTVRHARERYPLANVSFEVGSITDPAALAAEAPFDVITCFEAIEHVDEQDRMMELVRNRLAPGGVFLCSTPDVEVYTHEHGNDNPFHVHELTETAFRELLGASFEHVVMLRQNVAVGSLVHGGEHGSGNGAETLTLQPDNADGWRVDAGAPHTYFLAVASARPVDVPGMSALVDASSTLVAQAHARAEQARVALDRANAEAERSRQDIGRLTAALAQVEADRDAAVQQVERVREEQRRLAEDLGEAQRKASLYAERLEWLTQNNNEMSRTVGELAAENGKLRAETSGSVYRAVSRYRTSIEKLAPRGTRRRDFYEAALGRPTGVPPETPQARGPVAVATSDEPRVSVVIPTYGNWPYTAQCLASIQQHLPATPFEVIVVDDASPDDSADRVAQCPGCGSSARPATWASSVPATSAPSTPVATMSCS
ncbi:hypothetical protein GCM10029964_124220 [Kibdelosporangium lantanae]